MRYRIIQQGINRKGQSIAIVTTEYHSSFIVPLSIVKKENRADIDREGKNTVQFGIYTQAGHTEKVINPNRFVSGSMAHA